MDASSLSQGGAAANASLWGPSQTVGSGLRKRKCHGLVKPSAPMLRTGFCGWSVESVVASPLWGLFPSLSGTKFVADILASVDILFRFVAFYDD